MPEKSVTAAHFNDVPMDPEFETDPTYNDYSHSLEIADDEPVPALGTTIKKQTPRKSVVSPSFRIKEDWHTAAACKGLDQDIFYTDKNTEALMAKFFCGHCVVANECLITALRYEGSHRTGVFGGLTHKERGVVLRKVRDMGSVAAGVFIDSVRSDAQRKLTKLVRLGILDMDAPRAEQARQISEAS